MSLQAYFDAFSREVQSGDACAYRAGRCSGWFLSDVDTWHECPVHPGRPHPEDDFQNPYEGCQWTWCGPAPKSFKCLGDAGTIGADLDLELDQSDIPF